MPGDNEFSIQTILNRIFDPTNNWLSINDAEAYRRMMLNGTLLTPLGAAWTAAVTGSGATNVYPAYVQANTGTTTGSTSRLYVPNILLQGTNFPVDFSKRLLWSFVLSRVTSDSALIARVQLKVATTEGALAAAGLGVRMANLTLTGESYGSAGAFTATIQTMLTTVAYHILVDHEPAVPRTRWYVNGVLQATQSTAANMPSASLENTALLMSILNGAGTANGVVQISAPQIFQEH